MKCILSRTPHLDNRPETVVFEFGQREDRCAGSERHPHYGGAKWSLRAEFGIKFA